VRIYWRSLCRRTWQRSPQFRFGSRTLIPIRITHPNSGSRTPAQKDRKKKRDETFYLFYSFPYLDILDTTHVAKVIKKFRFGVAHAQRYMREMLETEKIQLNVLVKQWNRAEHELETAFYHRLEKERTRQVIMSKSLYYEGTSARPIKVIICPSSPCSFSCIPPHGARARDGVLPPAQKRKESNCTTNGHKLVQLR
jgi:hypothetical protein